MLQHWYRNPDYNSPFSNGIRKIDEYEYDSYDDSSYNGHHDLQSESQIMNNFYDIFPDFNNFMSFWNKLMSHLCRFMKYAFFGGFFLSNIHTIYENAIHIQLLPIRWVR